MNLGHCDCHWCRLHRATTQRERIALMANCLTDFGTEQDIMREAIESLERRIKALEEPIGERRDT